ADMLRAGMEHAGDDMLARALREQVVEADRVIKATQHALWVDGKLLSPEERAGIDKAIAVLRELREGSDHRAIKAGIEALARATDDFAARRMDQSIRSALAGRNVNEITT